MLQGWSYVGDRLLSAVVPYEESGWYDGQMWVKPPEVGTFSSFSFPFPLSSFSHSVGIGNKHGNLESSSLYLCLDSVYLE